VGHVRADFLVAAWFDHEAVAAAGAKVNVANGDTAAARFKDGKCRPAVGAGNFKLGNFADRSRLADAFAADDSDVVVAFQNEVGSFSNAGDVFRQPALEGEAEVGVVAERHEFMANEFGFPEQVLIWMVERRTRNFAPLARKRY